MRLGNRTVVLAVAALGTLALPAPALAGNAIYSGTVEQARQESDIPAPTIEFRVRVEGGRPVDIMPFTVHNAWFRCADGEIYYPGAYRETRSKVHISIDVPVKKNGRFSFKDPIYSISGSGRIPRRGRASGTVRLATRLSAPQLDCDSGPLRWTAKRR